jgi:hypothetical protein
MGCIECLSQYHYYDTKTSNCYLQSTASKSLDNKKGLISDVKGCKVTKKCDDFRVSQYETTKFSVTLGKYESCIVQVSNTITYDKDSQTEPTFVISSATEGGLEYSYNRDMKNFLSDPVRDGRIVDHHVPIYVRLTNDGRTKGSIQFQLIAKMRSVKSCVEVEPKSCINCVSQAGH